MTTLYLITPPKFVPQEITVQLDMLLREGLVSAVQLRLKEASDALWQEAAQQVQPVCARHGVPFLLNDRVDLCQALKADGVHLGRDDMPYAAARQKLGNHAIIGVSAYNDQARALMLAEQGADYVAFGAFFHSPTKIPPAKAEIKLLSWWAENVKIPAVAIGGITPDNCEILVRAGADSLAVISALWNCPDGALAALRQFAKTIRNCEGLEKDLRDDPKPC